MDNNQLIDKLTDKTGFSRQRVESLLSAYVKVIESMLSQGASVSIKGFGVLETAEKPERKVFNPKTRQYKIVPKRNTVKFKPSSVLKSAFKGE